MSETNDSHAKDYHELGGADGLKKLEGLIKGIHICMMTTVAEDGSMDSRPMAPQQMDKLVETGGVLWFLTRDSSEMVEEVEQDHHVTLTFAEPSNSKYVTLKGTGSSSKDKAKIHELWNDMYKAWFPGGEDDPQITVIRVNVSEADYWEASSSKLVVYAKYLAAAVTGGSVPVGETGHVSV